MKKNLLLSLVAASAPMMAFADANVPVNTDKGAKGWYQDTATDEFEISTNDVFTTGGSHVACKKTLLPGKYVLTVGAESDNAQVMLAYNKDWSSADAGVIDEKHPIDGVKWISKEEVKAKKTIKKDGKDVEIEYVKTATNTYEVTKKTEVWLRVCRSDEGVGGLKAVGVKATLDYDFVAAATEFDNEAIFQLDKVDKVAYPEDAKELERRASEIKAQILEIENAQDAEGGYDVYEKYSLYVGVKNTQLWNDIQKLKKDIEDKAGRVALHTNAIAVQKTLNDAVKGVNYLDAEGNVDGYAHGKWNAEQKKIQNKVDAFFENVADYNAEGYTETYSDAKVAAFNKEVTEEVNKLQGNVDESKADNKAYKDNVDAVEAVKASHLKVQKDLTALMMPGNGDVDKRKNVYDAMLDQATAVLAEASRLVINTEFTGWLGTENNHDSAKENNDKMQQQIKLATQQINDAETKYSEWYKGESQAYKKEMEHLTTLRNNLELEYQPNADIDQLKKAASDAIDALEEVVLAKNTEAGKWDLHNYVNSQEYQDQCKVIKEKTDAYSSKVVSDVNNYNSFTALQKSLTDLNNKLSDAKKTVGKLTYDQNDYKYKAADQNNTDNIDGKKGSLTVAKANVGDKYDAKKSYTNDLVNVAAIEKDITNYQDIAETSYESYKTVVGLLVEDQKLVKELSETVGTEGYVTSGATTYGDIIKDRQAKVNKGNDNLTEACKKQNAEHQSALAKVYTSQKNIIGDDIKQFPVDKKTYVDNINIATATQLWHAADDAVNYIKNELNKIDLTETGTKNDEFTKELNAINADVKVYEDQLKTYQNQDGELTITAENALEASAELNKVQKATEGIKNRAKDLTEKVKKQKEVVQAENAKWNELNSSTGELGILHATIEHIKQYKDSNREDEFDKKYNEVNDLYNVLYADAENAWKNETLRKDWVRTTDQKGTDGNMIPGLQGRCENIQKTAEKYAGQADACAKNRAAYDAVKNYINQCNFGTIDPTAGLLGDAQDQLVNGVVTNPNKPAEKLAITGEAQNHYKAELKELDTQLAGCKKNIEDSYADPKREMEKLKDSYIVELNGLVASIKGLPKLAAANESARIEFEKSSLDIDNRWKEVYAYISENDKTSQRDVYLSELNAEQKKLIQLDAKVKGEFEEGKLEDVDTATDRRNEYSTILNKIEEISARQQGKYSEVVAAENKAYFIEFTAEYDRAIEAHKVAASKIEAYFALEITDPVLYSKIETLTKEHELDIYNVMKQAKDLQKEFNEKYTANLKTGLVFEFPEKTSLKTVKGYTQQIKTYTTDLVDAAKVEAEKLLNGSVTAANVQLTAAQNELKTGGEGTYTYYETWESAFADVRKNIEAADKFAPAAESDYVLALAETEHVQNLDEKKVTEDLNTGKYTAASVEWQHFLNKTATKGVSKATQIQNWINAINEFTYPDQCEAGKCKADHLKAIGQYQSNFNYHVQAYILPDNIADNKEAVAGDYSDCERVYKEASSVAQNKVASDKAYTELVEGSKNFKNNFNALDAQLQTLVTYANAYKISLEEAWMTKLSAFEKDYKYSRAEVDAAQKTAGVANIQIRITCELNSYAKHLDITQPAGADLVNLFKAADDLQYTSLDNYIKELKKEVNAAVANLPGDQTVEEYKQYTLDIAQYEKSLEAAKSTSVYDAKTNATAKHDSLVLLQGKVAASLESLRAKYNQASIDAINTRLDNRFQDVQSLYDRLNTLVTSEETHQPVREKYEVKRAEADKVLQEAKDYRAAHAGEILYYEKNVDVMLDKVVALHMESTISELNDDEFAYDDHESTYANYSKDLKTYADYLANIYPEITNYQHKDPSYEVRKNDLDLRIANENKFLEAHKVGNTPNVFSGHGIDAKVNEVSIAEDIQKLQKDAAMAEFDDLYGKYAKNEGNPLQSVSLKGVDLGVDVLLTPEDRVEYEALRDSLEGAYKNLFVYNGQLENDKVNVDIDGNLLFPGQPNTKLIKPYLNVLKDEHNYQEVHKRVAELNAKTQALIDNIAANRITRGDVDKDGDIVSNDYMKVLAVVLQSAAMPEDAREAARYMMRADVNGDGMVNIGDVVYVNNIIRGVQTRAMLMAHPLSLQAREADNIALSVEGEGTTRRIAIFLNNSVSYVGCQLDINLPAGVTLIGESVGDRATAHELYSNDLENGAHRIVVSSVNNDVFANENGAIIYLDVEVSHRYNGEGIQVSNVMFSDPGSQVYHLNSLNGGETTGVGTVTLTEELKSKVYNVGGQLMNGLKKGVNIMMMKDGSVKKVIKK